TVAELLDRGGYTPRLGEHPDLTVRVIDRDYVIECKRIFSPAKVIDRLREAGKQLHADRKNVTAATRGIVAISLSRVLSPEGQAFRIVTRDRGRAGLDAWLEQIRAT